MFCFIYPLLSCCYFFIVCFIRGRCRKFTYRIRAKGIVTEHKIPSPNTTLEMVGQFFFSKNAQRGNSSSLALAPTPPQICPIYITEQSMLMVLLMPKYNYLLITLWTPWLPWWTAGLLGKCVRNCRTLCPESGHFHSSSWTWEMEWPRSGKRVSISHKKQKAQLKLNLISVAYLIWLPSESIWRAYSMTLCIPFSFKSL